MEAMGKQMPMARAPHDRMRFGFSSYAQVPHDVDVYLVGSWGSGRTSIVGHSCATVSEVGRGCGELRYRGGMDASHPNGL